MTNEEVFLKDQHSSHDAGLTYSLQSTVHVLEREQRGVHVQLSLFIARLEDRKCDF